jgi:hypothetical protein
MLLDTVAGETANELNSLSSTSDQKQTGRTVPSLIHKNGPKEMNASISWSSLYKYLQFLYVVCLHQQQESVAGQINPKQKTNVREGRYERIKYSGR